MVVLVEGPHDEAIIRAFCPEFADRVEVKIIPMQGTEEIVALPHWRMLFNLTDARFLVVTDNVDDRWAQDVHNSIRKAKSEKQRHAILGCERSESGEERAFLELIGSAIDADRLDRFDFFGFAKRDIVHYLPVERIDPEFSSWDELAVEFLRATGKQGFERGDGKIFKRWVNKRTKGNYKYPHIRNVASEIVAQWSRQDPPATARPPEFSDLSVRVNRMLAGR